MRILVLAWGHATHRAVCTSTRRFSLTTQKVAKQHFYSIFFFFLHGSEIQKLSVETLHCCRPEGPLAVSGSSNQKVLCYFRQILFEKGRWFYHHRCAWMQTPGEKLFQELKYILLPSQFNNSSWFLSILLIWLHYKRLVIFSNFMLLQLVCHLSLLPSEWPLKTFGPLQFWVFSADRVNYAQSGPDAESQPQLKALQTIAELHAIKPT